MTPPIAPPDQREALIQSAERLFRRHGYGAAGARLIAAEAGAPQGSFTNHFRSKEVLAVAALDRYFARLAEVMLETLEDRARPPQDRLLAYFDEIAGRFAESGWREGCLIPDLAAEIPQRSELIRLRLAEIMAEQAAAFEAALAEMTGPEEARDLAAFVVAAWHGALLRMKVERSPEPLRRFRRVAERLIATAAASAEAGRPPPDAPNSEAPSPDAPNPDAKSPDAPPGDGGAEP